MSDFVKAILEKYNFDQTRLMDILIDIQSEKGYIPPEYKKVLADNLNLSVAEVEQTISFYHFFSEEPRGKYTIYLNNSVVANMMGREKIKEAFEKEVGIKFGNVTDDGLIGLFDTSCIGMSDQEPAAIINGVIFPRLTTFRVKEIIRDIRDGKSVEELQVQGFGDGQNELIKSTVYNNIRKKGPVIFSEYKKGSALKKIVELDPEDVIETIKKSKIRGRGGAGFPTGFKWDFCRKTKADKRYVFCNADEGEPGTFKDRVILTELPHLVFEGMALAGYAIGSDEGILYIRYEYRYLKDYLENILDNMRKENLLGKSILGKKGFDFDIRIQFGAGAYVCGEESALIESAEGKRGEPRDRPPFPVEVGYLGKPTVVNNVETLCSAVRVIEKGAEWYTSLGTEESSGTKVLSVSGDCRYPGIYEVEWGFNVRDILEMVGADDVAAVQVGGPSGSCIGPDEFDRVLGYEDLATGGSLIIFNESRNLLKNVVLNFMDFFIEESCGSCSLCRALTVMLRDKLLKILNGKGCSKDLDDIREWSASMKANRCGLGQTAPNPILTTLKNFPELYLKLIDKNKDYKSEFDMEKSVEESCSFVGRTPKL